MKSSFTKTSYKEDKVKHEKKQSIIYTYKKYSTLWKEFHCFENRGKMDSLLKKLRDYPTT